MGVSLPHCARRQTRPEGRRPALAQTASSDSRATLAEGPHAHAKKRQGWSAPNLWHGPSARLRVRDLRAAVGDPGFRWTCAALSPSTAICALRHHARGLPRGSNREAIGETSVSTKTPPTRADRWGECRPTHAVHPLCAQSSLPLGFPTPGSYVSPPTRLRQPCPRPRLKVAAARACAGGRAGSKLGRPSCHLRVWPAHGPSGGRVENRQLERAAAPSDDKSPDWGELCGRQVLQSASGPP